MPFQAIHPPSKGRLFFALLWNSSWSETNVFFEKLEASWGPIHRNFEPTYYPMENYYAREMGEGLLRSFRFATPLVDRECLIDAKEWSMEIEQQWSIDGKRQINIDPGLICLEQLLLISTKPYAHRISIGRNLYAELTYTFEQGHYKPLPWTYPDYVFETTKGIFEEERTSLKKIL